MHRQHGTELILYVHEETSTLYISSFTDENINEELSLNDFLKTVEPLIKLVLEILDKNRRKHDTCTQYVYGTVHAMTGKLVHKQFCRFTMKPFCKYQI